MPDNTTIQVNRKTAKELRNTKMHPRQTYSELIDDLLMAYKAHKKQYDSFLHKIQQEKMRELWDNKEDGAWEHA